MVTFLVAPAGRISASAENVSFSEPFLSPLADVAPTGTVSARQYSKHKAVTSLILMSPPISSNVYAGKLFSGLRVILRVRDNELFRKVAANCTLLLRPLAEFLEVNSQGRSVSRV